MLLCVLGRQPEFSLAELESIFGYSKLNRITDDTVLLDEDRVDIDRFGGLLKTGQVQAETAVDEQELLEACLSHLPKSESKITVGISWHGSGISVKKAFAFALELKKQAKRSGKRVRIVPNKQLALSSAQVLHNGLTTGGNMEFLIARRKSDYVLAKTDRLQDIEGYGARDHGRPARDAKVGMLPPKLAQIMLNLALGQVHQEQKTGASSLVVLDPFCGTGVVLQEALLMDHDVCGSDIEQRMIDMSRENLDWLARNRKLETRDWKLQRGDARNTSWDCAFDMVVSEIYLGPPMSQQPASEELKAVATEIDALLTDTLENIARQAKPQTRLCLAVPAWSTKNGYKRLVSVDALEDIGYNLVSFKVAGNEPLIYSREGQIVARELIVLTKV